MNTKYICVLTGDRNTFEITTPKCEISSVLLKWIVKKTSLQFVGMPIRANGESIILIEQYANQMIWDGMMSGMIVKDYNGKLIIVKISDPELFKDYLIDYTVSHV